MYDSHRYSALKPSHWGYYALAFVALLIAVHGLYAAHTVEQAGHHITGMNNHVVWGLPHVFAIALIVAASGALNGASFASVFGSPIYKPYARLSVILAISLLVGGLLVLVLDLGRPDRLIIAMTTYNFRSIFSWNIFLYTGFLLIGVLYLWMMIEKRYNRRVRSVGIFALCWRLILTTGTGSIFGFLVGRNALDSALMAPLFIALSLVLGTAFFAITLITIARWQNAPTDITLLDSLEKHLLWFLLILVYFSVVHHITNLYNAEHHATEQHQLTGPLSGAFWIGHVIIGIILPVCLLLVEPIKTRVYRLMLVTLSSALGSCVLLYVIVIGSQSTPQRLFPGHTVLSSRFGDAGFPAYQATHWEWSLGFGGLAVAILLCLALLRILPLTPEPPPQGAIDG